jgi:hypothetical protein
VRKEFSPVRLALYALCALSLFGLRAHGQDRDRDRDKDQPDEHPNGIVQDWSHRHVVYPSFGPIESLIAVQHDPRALLGWQDRSRREWRRINRRRHPHDTISGIHRDWSISLGAGTTAPAMYPAKFTFSPSAVPNCATDFVVYPINVLGSVTQPTIVAFNNLYSGGTSGAPTGLCGSRAVVSGDDRSSATTLWSYKISTIGAGQIPTSPALSLDGTKVAFVESGLGQTHFHVLAWKSGDGVDITTPNAQNVLKPAIIPPLGIYAALAPAAGSGTVTDLSLGSSTDTLSSPFVDYVNDVAYVGNDDGVLFRI